MKRTAIFTLILGMVLINAQSTLLHAQTDLLSEETIFNDKLLLDGYAEKYTDEPIDILMEMVKDDNLNAYKMAAAVRVFRDKHSDKVFSREKAIIEKTLIRRLHRSTSAFVQVEIMHTLCLMDRYRYFNSMVPTLIRKLDHYNSAVNELAYAALLNITETGHNRAREARIVFNTLRRVLFLSRKRLANVTEPGPRLAQKLKLLRWSIKILGTQELRRLPKEVIGIL